MELPKEPERGDRITADWARRVARALRALRLTAGPGIRIHAGPDGTTVSAKRPAPQAGGAYLCAAALCRATGTGTAGQGAPCSVHADGPHMPATGQGLIFFSDVAMGDPNGRWFVAASGLVFETGGSDE